MEPTRRPPARRTKLLTEHPLRCRRRASVGTVLLVGIGLIAPIGAPAAGGTAVTAADARQTAAVAADGSRARTYTPPTPRDLSRLTWTQAFHRLHHKIAREYAFTDWKGIDWRGLYARHQPRIARAQADADRKTYYLTLRAYIHEVHDGHVSMMPAHDATIERRIAGGGFGLTVARLDSGDVVATWIQRGGPADLAGVERGARILRWNGVGVDRALRRTSTLLSPSQPTHARTRYERLRYLVRARIGDLRTVAFRNRGDDRVRVARLRAVDDDGLTLTRTDSSSVLNRGWPERMVEHRLLAGKVGYLRVYALLDLPPQMPGDHTPTLTLFRRAIREFRAAGVSGIILDVRSNSGGSDQMVADMLSSFYPERTLYEYARMFDARTGRFGLWLEDEKTQTFLPNRGVFIEPTAPRFRGPVVALVDNGCISSGEGLAMGVANLPRGRVVGFYGTNGSFGMAGGAALMPGGYEIHWPYGQSVDRNLRVQIDSRHGEGGILPDHRVPKTLQRVLRDAAGHDVVLDEGLQVLRSM